MPYSPTNLTATILLLGNMLGALDFRSRKLIGAMLAELALSPDESEDIAAKSAALATTQKPITKNAELNRALHNNKQGVETGLVDLEKK